MAQVDYRASGNIYSQIINAAAASTVTCLTPATGQAVRIKCICCYATAATAADVHVTLNAGTSIVRLGGVGTNVLNGPLLFGGDAQGTEASAAIVGPAGDALKVVLTTTSGTNTEVAVIYDFVNT